MRFLAVAVGTIVGGVILSFVLVLLLVGAAVLLGFGDSPAANLLLVLCYPAGFALAGWASYRQYGVARPKADAQAEGSGTALEGAPEAPAKARRVTPWAPVIAIVVFIGIAIAWVVNAEREARRDARAFCGSAVAGQPMAPIVARAENAGIRMGRVVSPGQVTVVFVGMPPFSRHICTVSAENGVIRRAGYSTLD